MDRQPTHSGLWLGANPSLPDQGPRWRRRRSIHTSSQVHRYSRSPDVSSLTLAKRLCRTADRFDPQGMHGPHRGIRHLRQVLLSYMDYYNGTRTHLSLGKDAPISRGVERSGSIFAVQSLAVSITNI